MKSSEIEPGCALAFGYVGAPIMAGVNAVVLDALFGHASPGSAEVYPELVFFAMTLSVPLGFMTMNMLEIWKAGYHAKARALGIVYGVLASAFWMGLLRISHPTWDSPALPRNLGAMLIPFLWSVLLPIFAIFARPPRP